MIVRKCPTCGRKIEGISGLTSFKMPEHLNYMKSATCPESGKAQWAGLDEAASFPHHIDDATLAILARYTNLLWRGR